MKHKCNQVDKEKYDDCFDCIVWHRSGNWETDTKWKCKNCGQYSADTPACPECKKLRPQKNRGNCEHM